MSVRFRIIKNLGELKINQKSTSNKILLINPKISWINSPTYDRIWPPLSLAYSATILEKNGLNVEIMDANAQNITPQEIIRTSKSFDKIFFTTSPLDKWQCPEPNIKSNFELIKEISKVNPDINVIGAHGTVKPKETLQLTNAKTIIMGEPEETILDICKEKNLKKIDGIAYKENGKIIINKKRKSVDINKLPLPAFHLLPMEKYEYEILGKNFTLFEGSRGCPFSCSYCFKSVYSKENRVKAPEKLISEVKYSIENYNVKKGYFIDLEFSINRNLVVQICDFLIKQKYDFNWTCQTRFDTIDYNLLKKMKEAGCKIIHFGVESGSQKILDKTNKQITVEQMKKTMKIIKKAKIKTVCFFMFGLLGETNEDMEMTIKLAKELNPTYASFHIAVPYPETEFYNQIKGKIKTEDLFPAFYGDKDELEKIRKKAYYEFYLRPDYLIKRIARGDLSLLFKQIKLFMKYMNRNKGDN